MELINILGVHRLSDAQASGTSAFNTPSVDLSKGEGVLFLGSLGTAAANNTVTVTQSEDNATFSAVSTGLEVTVSGNKFAINVYRALQKLGKHGRLEFARGTASAIGEVWALVYCGRVTPFRQDNDVDVWKLVSPEVV